MYNPIEISRYNVHSHGSHGTAEHKCIFHENILEFMSQVAEGTSTGNHEVFPHKLCLTRNAVKPHNF